MERKALPEPYAIHSVDKSLRFCLYNVCCTVFLPTHPAATVHHCHSWAQALTSHTETTAAPLNWTQLTIVTTISCQRSFLKHDSNYITRLHGILWWCPHPTLWANHHFNLYFTGPSVATSPTWSPHSILVPQICTVLSGSQPWITLFFLPFILAWWNPINSTPPKSFTSIPPKWDAV